jgi:hypothetical protein
MPARQLAEMTTLAVLKTRLVSILAPFRPCRPPLRMAVLLRPAQMAPSTLDLATLAQSQARVRASRPARPALTLQLHALC